MSQSIPSTRVGRLLLARRRLAGAVLAGIATGLILPMFLPDLRWPTRLLAAWDVTALLYVVFAFRAMHGSSVADCRRRAALYDENDWVILFLIIGAAAASFGAIVAELIAIKTNEIDKTMGAAIIGATVVLSWTFVHVVYALHYAHLYYRPQKGGHPGGLRFPGDEPPVYPDFLYYSFVIGCAAQTADVATVSREMRRLTLIHGVVSFAFNTMILALMINTASTLITDR